MKLVSLRVRNYRIHRDTAVTFADGFTVLTAPNEFGKSTLVEAMHRALFLGHRSGGHAREAMQSRFGGNPEVELRFTTAGSSWRLRKVFAGGGSSVCELVDETRALSWRSTEAEERLAQLTGREAAGGRQGDVDAAWDHLWVWQGKANVDPLATQAGRAELARALGARADVGGGMELAAGDSALLRAARAAVDAAWTKNRKDLLRDSEAGGLQRRVDELRGQRDATQARRIARAADADELQATRAELAAARAEATRLAPELERLEGEVRELRPIVEGARLLALRHEQAIQAAADFDAVLRRCDATARALGAAADAEARAAAEETSRRGDHDADQALASASAARVRDADTALATARRQADCLRALADAARCRDELARRRAEADDRAVQARAVAAAESALAEALPITSKDAAAIAKAARELADVEARLSGAAARLVRTAGTSPLLADGKPLAVGSELHVDRTLELAHADGTRLLVHPGGGEVAALTADADQRRAALRALLAQHGVADADEARARVQQRDALQETARSAAAVLRALPDPTAELARLPARLKQLEAQAADLQAVVGALPADADAAAMQRRIDGAEATAAAARDAATTASQRTQQSGARWQEARDDLAARKGATMAATTAAAEADAAAGPAAGRRARQDALHGAATALAHELAAAKPKAAALAITEAKLKAATAQRSALDARIQTLAGAAGVFEQRLGGDRGEDLDAALEGLTADLERAERSAAAARRRAEADKLLLAVLEGIQAEQRERREQPFVDACAVYLALAHGPGVRIGLAGDEQRQLGLVDRSTAGLGAFDFADLSQGGQELTALAARLAMAEVLAAEQPDRALPLVLDDSVTNVDPERLRHVGYLLATAATRGVQIVFATCDTERAGGLRAQQVVRLQRPSWDGAAPSPRHDAERTARDETVAAPAMASDEDATALTVALRAAGGEASARALREALAWEKGRFDAARDALLAAGAVDVPDGSRSLRLRGDAP